MSKAKISKRQKIIIDKMVGQNYTVVEAIEFLQKQCPPLKFVESVDVSINLGVDPRKSDQMVRGSVVLPHGTGKKIRVAVFATLDQAQAALDAGADLVGFEDLFEKIKKGEIDFDLLIATPEAMRLVGQLGQILGPRGLMPNPKVGTVTADVASAVKNAKMGQIQYRMDKNGIVHCMIGKINFSKEALQDNLSALFTNLKKAKPSTAKGVFLKKVVLTSTMGPGLIVDQASL